MGTAMIGSNTRYHDPWGRFSLAVPEGWEVVGEPRVALPLVAVESQRPEAFRANLVFTASSLPEEMTLRDWQMGTDALLPTTLSDYLLLDLEHVEIDGVAGIRRLYCHVASGFAVTGEQWAVVHAGRGLALTATVATVDWDDVADAMAECASRLRLLDPESTS
ncbi:MAG: hypothetical protein ACT4QG_10850 [Sporichthyaceae bacterium]